MEAGQLLGRLLPRFKPEAAEVVEDLSAAVISGDGNLWVASDEAGMIERLTPTEARVYAEHRRLDMADFLGEVERGAELDIEALDMHADYLWVMGSHSAKRKRPKGKKREKDLERLATVAHEPQRFLLARIRFVKAELASELKRGNAREPHLGDHAEGMANFSYFDENDSVLVVYDSPAPQRCYGPGGVLADIFRLSGS